MTTTMTEVEALCSYCEAELDEEELESPYHDESGDVVCDACWYAECTDPCSRCDELWEKGKLESRPGELIAVGREAPGLSGDLQPGYYRVKEWPIYIAAIMGSAFFLNDALERVAELDPVGSTAAENAEFDAFPLCPRCQEQVEGLILAIPTDKTEP